MNAEDAVEHFTVSHCWTEDKAEVDGSYLTEVVLDLGELIL